MVLVGDSGAMTVLGHPSTVAVTHRRDARADQGRPPRRRNTPLLVADLPFGSYEVSDEQAIADRDPVRQGSRRRRGQTRAGRRQFDQPGQGDRRRRRPGRRSRRAHPQSATSLGGYRAQGRTRRVGDADRPRRGGSAGRRLHLHRVRGRARRADRRSDAADDACRSSASAPARPPTARCWCSTTCWASGRAPARSSSAGTPTCRTPWMTASPSTPRRCAVRCSPARTRLRHRRGGAGEVPRCLGREHVATERMRPGPHGDRESSTRRGRRPDGRARPAAHRQRGVSAAAAP